METCLDAAIAEAIEPACCEDLVRPPKQTDNFTKGFESMKRASIQACLIAFGVLMSLDGTFVGGMLRGSIARADDDTGPEAPTPQKLADDSSLQIYLHLKIFSVSPKRAADAQIDLAEILGGNAGAESAGAESAGSDVGSIMTTISVRERALLEKLLTVSGAAKVLAEPSLATQSGRKVKFFSGGEVLSPGPPQDGVPTKEVRDVGTRVDATPILDDDCKLSTELRIELSELDPSRTVIADGIEFPGIRTRWLDMGVKLSLDETVVLGGPAYDGLLVMVTPELGVSDSIPVSQAQAMIRDQPEQSDVARVVEDLQSSTDALQQAIRNLTAMIDQRMPVAPVYAPYVGSVEPPRLPNYHAAGPRPQSTNPPRFESLPPEVLPSSQPLSISTELIEPKSGYIKVGDSVTLHVTVTNTGEQTLSNVRSRMIAENGKEQLPRHRDDILRALRTLPPGESKLMGFDFVAEREGYVRNTVEVEADGGQVARLLHIVLVAKPGANQKAIDRRTTGWPDRVESRSEYGNQDGMSGVQTGWEQISTGRMMYTIRIGSTLLKPLRDGNAIDHPLDSSSEQLREFRIVMGPASRQASFTGPPAAFEIDYGWRPNKEGGLDYYVQLSREQLDELAEGRELNCHVHPDVKSIDKIYVFVGDAKLPQIAAP